MTAPKLLTLHLRRGSAKPMHAGHPWVFADAVEKVENGPGEPGDEARVVDHLGQVLGRGYFSPKSAIAVRLLTRQDRPADESLLAQRIDEALQLRREALGLGREPAVDDGVPTDAYRLIHSEGDALGGLVVDRYADLLCIQIGTAGMDRRRETILDLLEARLKPRAILDKSDNRIRKLESLETPASGVLRGTLPEAELEVRESGIRFGVSPAGQKTGLFLDQRENRERFAAFAAGREVLDVFSYTGGFALHAARAGAKSLALIEASEPALKAAKRNLELNGVADADLICAPWTEGFRHLREAQRTFDLIALDPPKFARGRTAEKEALAAYRELNGQAVRLLRPGGILFTCSCSGSVSTQDFERAVASGLSHAGRRGTVLEVRGAAADHPVPPGFDQGRYLKCMVVYCV